MVPFHAQLWGKPGPDPLIPLRSDRLPPAATRRRTSPAWRRSCPGAPHTTVDVAWSVTNVRYLWCLRHEISSTPMFTNPLNRSGSRTSAETRWHIAPTVRHATRANVATVDLSERVTSHTTRSSKSDVNRAPRRANGTPSVTTPWTGQASRRRRILSRHRRPPRSRCLQDESTSRRSYRRDVVNEHTGQANTRRRRQTSMTTDPPPAGSSRSTPTTRSPGRSRTRFSKVVARTGGSRIGCCRSPDPTSHPCHNPHTSRTTPGDSTPLPNHSYGRRAGETSAYSSAGSDLLSAILTHAVGTSG